MKAPHYRGSYHRKSRALVKAAYANPDTQCWRCGRTLNQHPPTKTGKAPRWSAGHVVDGQVEGQLAPEVLSCNSSAGATYGNRRRGPRTPWTW